MTQIQQFQPLENRGEAFRRIADHRTDMAARQVPLSDLRRSFRSRRIGVISMKRSLAAVLLVSMACSLAFASLSKADRIWALDGPGGRFGYVQTTRWGATQEDHTLGFIRNRTVLIGHARFSLTDTQAGWAVVGFAALGGLLWMNRGGREASVKY